MEIRVTDVLPACNMIFTLEQQADETRGSEYENPPHGTAGGGFWIFFSPTLHLNNSTALHYSPFTLHSSLPQLPFLNTSTIQHFNGSSLFTRFQPDHRPRPTQHLNDSTALHSSPSTIFFSFTETSCNRHGGHQPAYVLLFCRYYAFQLPFR